MRVERPNQKLEGPLLPTEANSLRGGKRMTTMILESPSKTKLGVGLDPNIVTASLRAVVSAVNRG